MNERIRELAKAYLVHERYTRYGEIVEEDLYEFYPDELAKFALLIVRECAGVIEGMADPEEDSDRYFWAIQNASANLRQHFGVE